MRDNVSPGKKNVASAWFRVVEVALIFLFFSALVYGWMMARETQGRLVKLQQKVELAPYEMMQQSRAEALLREEQSSIDNVLALSVRPDNVGLFIADLESLAKRYGVSVNVPSIQENQRLNESGALIPWDGPYKEVKLSILASGEASNLMQFLHGLEYAPYAIRVSNWSFKVSANKMPVFAVPVGMPSEEKVGQSAAPRSVTTLEAQLILTVHNDEV